MEKCYKRLLLPYFQKRGFLAPASSEPPAFNCIPNVKDFTEYAECDAEILTCKAKTWLITKFMEVSLHESNEGKDCAAVESMPLFNKAQAILQKLATTLQNFAKTFFFKDMGEAQQK